MKERLRQNLPSLTALLAFDVAAKELHFTRAAQHLNVTQAAISKQIKYLEQDLNCQLFERQGRRISLTPEGQSLKERLSAALDHIEDISQILRQRLNADRITIATNTAVAHFWLSPTLDQFSLDHPKVELKAISSDRSTDLTEPDVDIAVVYGRIQHTDWELTPLVAEALLPVASPAFVEKHGLENATMEQILSLPLLDYQKKEPDWINWREWLQKMAPKSPRPETLRTYGSYIMVINAALRGTGIALGSRYLIGDLLERRELVTLTDRSLETGRYYYLAKRKSRQLGESAAALYAQLAAHAIPAERG